MVLVVLLDWVLGISKKEKIKKITSDTFTNSIILKRYGKAFFLELDIPENHIFNFISHCKKFNIKELYNKGFFLQIAVILERRVPCISKH